MFAWISIWALYQELSCLLQIQCVSQLKSKPSETIEHVFLEKSRTRIETKNEVKAECLTQDGLNPEAPPAAPSSLLHMYTYTGTNNDRKIQWGNDWKVYCCG